MVLRHMFGGHHGAANDEQVDTGIEHGRIIVLGALRRQGSGYGESGITDFMQTLHDELRLDRLGVDLLDASGGLIRRQLCDFVKQRLRIVISGPQAFQIQHTQRAHLAHGDGGGRAGHRIHRRTDDRNIEFIGIDLP